MSSTTAGVFDAIATVLFAILIGLLFHVALVWISKFLRETRSRRTSRRIACKQAELVSVQADIREFESSICSESTFIRATADSAVDYGSDPWQARNSKRLAGVNNDREQLVDLLVQEAEIKRELGIV